MPNDLAKKEIEKVERPVVPPLPKQNKI